MRIESPLHTVDFLDDFHKILESKFTVTTMDQCLDSAGIPVFELVRVGIIPYAGSETFWPGITRLFRLEGYV